MAPRGLKRTYGKASRLCRTLCVFSWTTRSHLCFWRLRSRLLIVSTSHERNFATLKPQSCLVQYIGLRDLEQHMINLQLLQGARTPGKLKTFKCEVRCSWAWYKLCGRPEPDTEHLQDINYLVQTIK